MDASQEEKNINEKINATPDHVENISHSNDSTDGDVSKAIINNKYAVKGDESDGKIVWYWKTRIAAFSLVLLYVVAYTLAVAAVCPFAGYLQDLMGRRYITLLGCTVLLLGIGLVGGTHHFGQGVAGMALAGAGAGIGELTALAGVSEIVPVNKRGLFLAVVTAGIFPFAPYVLYAQYFSTYSTWRWGMWITIAVNGISTVGILLTYFPKRVRPMDTSKMDVIKKIDYIGAFLSIVGLTLFLVALQSGGYTHSWTSAYVLCPLLIGIFLIVAFCIWEWKGAKYPMVPKEIFAGQRIVGLAFGIAFISGMDFYSALNFFPLIYEELFERTPIAIGSKAIGAAFGVCLGAVLINALLSVYKNHNRELLLFSCVLMTAFGGALAAVTPERPGYAIAFGILGGFGIGGVLVPAATIAITVTPDAFIATTVALSLAIRVIGGSIGYSIYYNIFANKLKTKLPLYIGEYAVKAGLPLTSAPVFVGALLLAPKTVANIPGVTPAILHAAEMGSRWAYADSLAYVWYVSTAFGVCSIIACCFLGNIRPYLTHRIAVELAH